MVLLSFAFFPRPQGGGGGGGGRREARDSLLGHLTTIIHR